MATQPTQNAVPSESPRDLKFNAGKIDEFVTSLALRYTDRLGSQHYTIEGLRQLAQEAISGFGWILKQSFETGATLTLPNEALLWGSNGEYYRWSGSLPKTVTAGSTPASTGGVGQGAWVGIGDAALKTMLASSVGASMIGMAAGGTLQQIIHYVTPEQFGAIGDGTVHPLSERYTTLAAAKAVYPHVTSLTQTIDWAACQGADLYARAGGMVRSPRTAIYHLGSNYLELGINSKWDSGFPVSNDVGQCPRFTRNLEAAMPAFGQYCIVRVQNATAAGSADEFVRGVVFKGYCATYGLASRTAAKNTQRICFHMNYALGSQIEVAVKGGEYGIFGYSCWGGKGELIIDSCHKGLYADPVTPTPENPTPPANSNTTFDYRIKIDACPFGLVLRNCQYGKFTGYIEGAVIGWNIYDSTNESAVAITAIGCPDMDYKIGVEAWQGAIIYANGGNNRISMHWNQGYLQTNTTGKQGAYKSMSTLMSVSDPYPLPSGNNSMFYGRNVAALSIHNLNCDYSNSSTQGATYFCNVDSTSRLVFENCSVYFGSNDSRVAPALLGNIETVGGRYLVDAITPSGYTKIGPNYFVKSAWSLKAINAGDGRVTLAVNSDIPDKLKIHDVSAYVVTSAVGQPLAVSQFSASDTSVVFQTAVTTSAYSINWKAFVSWIA